MQPALPLPGRGDQPGVDQGLAGHFLLFREQPQCGVHGVLGAGADHHALRIDLQAAAAQPGGGGLPVDQDFIGARVVQVAGSLGGIHPADGRRQVPVAQGQGGHVQGQVDDSAFGTVLESKQASLGGHSQHIGSPPHFAAHQPAAGRFPVGPGDGAHVQPQEVGQQPVRGQGVPWAQAAEPDRIGDGISDGQVDRLASPLENGYPDCHAHNLPESPDKITHRLAIHFSEPSPGGARPPIVRHGQNMAWESHTKRSSAMTPAGNERLRELRNLVGNTPLLAIDLEYQGKPRRLYAKAENLNLTGSIKDRMAFHILQDGLRARGASAPTRHHRRSHQRQHRHRLFAALGRALGHPVKIFMPDWMSLERTRIMESYGATVIPVSREQGGFLGSIRMTEELAAQGAASSCHASSPTARIVEAHSQSTGPEIWAQLGELGLQPRRLCRRRRHRRHGHGRRAIT